MVARAEGRSLSRGGMRRLIVAMLWTRGRTPTTEAELERVAEWAESPGAGDEEVAGVLDGSLAIDLDGAGVVTRPRTRAERKEVRRAMKAADRAG